MWSQDRDYADLMRELWGSPSRWNVRKSYVDIADKLGVDEETVRNRLKRLREGGFLLGWRLFPNPQLMGRDSVFLYMETGDPARMDAMLPRLIKGEGVVTISRLFGNRLLVMVLDDKNHETVKGFDEMGFGEIKQLAPGIRLPESQFKLTSLDWRIIARMLRNAKRPVTEVGKEIGVSARTVKNRLNRMMDKSAIFVAPLTDVRKSIGISYQLIIEGDDGKMAAIDRMVTEKVGNVVFRAFDSGNGLIFGFTGKNLSEGTELERWIRHQPHVRSARLNIMEEVVYAFDWLEREAVSHSIER